jgi:DNA-binding response OmpR family regulator
MRILREFQYVNTVSCLTLAERVWGDAMTPDINIRVAISNLNKKLMGTSVAITKDNEAYLLTGRK